MRRLIGPGLALLLSIGPAFARIAPLEDTTTLVKGANSFTEGQARRRLESNGYAEVSALTKDEAGIWRGTATRNGATVRVAVDFKGDISMN